MKAFLLLLVCTIDDFQTSNKPRDFAHHDAFFYHTTKIQHDITGTTLSRMSVLP